MPSAADKNSFILNGSNRTSRPYALKLPDVFNSMDRKRNVSTLINVVNDTGLILELL
ncbi:hypothetical protein EZMO1_0936 [Endozoicomonas montiporae CL-33]|uniref:Uncharacterized protein n=1 Tax=Endozoicomonas montiporae CL-33 TaxID=570277 RepID=A0A142B8S5_9GAMM|nr:hypothetical protein EZMO1_0936 [Endozoicomonas montiporae CL-33]